MTVGVAYMVANTRPALILREQRRPHIYEEASHHLIRRYSLHSRSKAACCRRRRQ
jgi:hypothetical protein